MYQALYRKYRPQVFADVVGQEHVTRTLMNEIKSGRHSHAYLFTGSRGTGKTTCAKIFAKAVNCEHPVNGDPCNECETCRGIDSGNVLDVVEIDAASNNGVDSIRDIRDEANFTPVGGKYRVYIIDEVHMLSTGAFNALLKTLEEPPEHVKFILATTEVHKLPATILSRCQRFDFKRITPEEIAGRVLYVAGQEGLSVTPEAANLIARLADGALRDALSILDQCMGHGTDIDETVVNEVVGLTGKQHLFSLADAILRKDSADALSQINDLHNRSCDMERLCSELINHFRNLMVCKAVSNPQDLIVCSGPELEEYQATASAYTMTDIMETLNVLGDTLTFIRKGLNRRVEMEMAVIKLCSGALEESEVYREARPRPAVKPRPASAAPVARPAAPVKREPEAEKPVTPPVTEAARPPVEYTPNREVPAPAEEEIPLPEDDGLVPPPEEDDPNYSLVPPDEGPAEVPAEPVREPEPIAEPQVLAAETEVPQDAGSASSEDGPLSQAVWNELMGAMRNYFKPIAGSVMAKSSYRKGREILIVPVNSVTESALKDPFISKAVKKGTKDVFGTELALKTVTEEEYNKIAAGSAPAAETDTKMSEDPLAQFVKQAQELGLPIEIKE